MSKTTSSTETKETKPVSPKGTKTTEVILGTAASKLGSGLKLLVDMVGEFGKLEAKVSENTLLIADQEAKMEANAQALRNSIAQNRIELQQAYDSDKEAFVIGWLKENNCTAIANEELAALREELSQAKIDAEKEIKKEVAIVSNTLSSKHASELREKELHFKAQEANNVAQLAQKDEKIKFLEQQVEHWRDALNEERKASVQRAQASTVQQTFTSGK